MLRGAARRAPPAVAGVHRRSPCAARSGAGSTPSCTSPGSASRSRPSSSPSFVGSSSWSAGPPRRRRACRAGRAGRASATSRASTAAAGRPPDACHARDRRRSTSASCGSPTPRTRTTRSPRSRATAPLSRRGAGVASRRRGRRGATRRAALIPLAIRRSRSRAPAAMSNPRTLVEKIWDDHVVTQDAGAPAVLAVDLHLVHEVTSPQAFTGLRTRGLHGPAPGQDRRDRRSRHPDDAARPADHGHAGGDADRASSRRTAATSASRSTRSAATPRASSTSSGRSSG